MPGTLLAVRLQTPLQHAGITGLAFTPTEVKGMTLRRSIIALLAIALASPTAVRAATYSTANFTVDAPTADLAKKFGEWAEYYRKEKALDWLGKEMPQWSSPCPIQVQITMGSAGGATEFHFGFANGRPAVASQHMRIFGDAKRLLNSVLPHEITHTVLAYHFGRAVPRWADEGGSVLSENDEERYSHDLRCRELLNAGRGFHLRVLFQMKEYPSDMIVLYAQGYSVCAYLVEKGGKDGRSKLIQFLTLGMQGNDPNHHGTIESWNDAARRVYGFESVDGMEEAWLQALRTPPSRTAARDAGAGTKPSAPAAYASTTPASTNRTELRSSAAPSMPVLEPPVKARAAAPDFEPAGRPTHLPPVTPASTPAGTGSLPPTGIATAKPKLPEVPPPVLLPPEVPRSTKE